MNGKRFAVRAVVVWLSSAAFGFALAADPPPAAGGDVGISASAAAQIQAIVAEKATRTPDEAKLDSNLLYAMRSVVQASRGVTAMSQQPEYVRNFVDANVASNGTVKVTITASVSDALLAHLTALGATEINAVAQYDSITARVPVDTLLQIAQRPDVRFVDNFIPPITQRYVPTPEEEAAFIAAQALVQPNVFASNVIAHGADRVINTGINGAGVKVCVMSDGVNSLAAEVTAGRLPAGIDVVAGQAGSGDEGTAMLEIVHQIAPGAALGYATAFNGVAQTAANIQTLRNAPHNCDILVDDITYFLEPPFQEGPIAQAVTTVASGGALYLSSAGNSGSATKSTSGTYQGDFVSGGAAGAPISAVETGTLHQFAASTNYDTLTAQGGSRFESLNWSDPMGTSSNDYDFFALNSTGTSIIAQSTTTQAGAQNPQEYFNGTVFGAGTRFVILNYLGTAATRGLRIDTERGRLSIGTRGNTFGHNAGVNAITLAAVPTSSAGGGQFSAANGVETYSSDGPRKLFFNPAGVALTPGNVLFATNGGTTLNKVDLAAADCSATGVPGFFTFCGTSAAAPHAAAIAALVKSAKPTLTATQIRNAMTSTALDNEAAGYDFNAGAGITMADAAVRSVLTPLGVGTTFSPTSVAPNVSSQLSITIANSNAVALSSVAFTDNYPVNLHNAAAPNATITGAGCTGTLGAAASGTSLSISNAFVPAGVTCSYKVMVASAVNSIYVNSTGSVTTPIALNTAGAGASLTVSTVATLAKKSDFNGDGRSDILFENGASRWFEYMNGVAIQSGVAAPPIAAGWVFAGTGDFDGDGHADILWKNGAAPNQTWVQLLNGNMVVGGGPVTVALGYAPTFIADFDGDHKSDILFENGAGSRWVYHMNGASVLNTIALPGAAPGWTLVGVGDFNGDGQADLLWRNGAAPTQHWIYLLNNNVVSGGAGVTVAAGYTLTRMGDFSGDGKTDLLFENGTSRWFFYMNGAAVSTSLPVPGAAAGWTIVGTADFNGDGKTDLLWRNGAAPTQHWIYLWNGATVIGSGGFVVAPGYTAQLPAY